MGQLSKGITICCDDSYRKKPRTSGSLNLVEQCNRTGVPLLISNCSEDVNRGSKSGHDSGAFPTARARKVPGNTWTRLRGARVFCVYLKPGCQPHICSNFIYGHVVSEIPLVNGAVADCLVKARAWWREVVGLRERDCMHS